MLWKRSEFCDLTLESHKLLPVSFHGSSRSHPCPHFSSANKGTWSPRSRRSRAQGSWASSGSPWEGWQSAGGSVATTSEGAAEYAPESRLRSSVARPHWATIPAERLGQSRGRCQLAHNQTQLLYLRRQRHHLAPLRRPRLPRRQQEAHGDESAAVDFAPPPDADVTYSVVPQRGSAEGTAGYRTMFPGPLRRGWALHCLQERRWSIGCRQRAASVLAVCLEPSRVVDGVYLV